MSLDLRKILATVAVAVLSIGVHAFAQDVDNKLYIVGAFQGWSPENASEFTYSDMDGAYIFELNADETSREFKISVNKGDWGTFNSGVFGLVPGETYAAQMLQKNVMADLYAGGLDNIAVPWAGVWTIKVASDYSTIIATTETPNPGNPDMLFVIGWVNGEQWNPSNGIELIQISDGVYYNEDVNINGGSETGTAYFSVATTLGTWDDVNSMPRYGAEENDKPVVLNEANKMTFNGNNAWTIEAGHYSVEVDINNMTITMSDASGIENVEINKSDVPAVYYNLQGVEVENPANGMYIVKQGNNVSKVILK